LANVGFEDYFISQMFENIKFDMDEKGARVENEAVIVMEKAAFEIAEEKVKKFILNKPYWIVMKRIDSQNPYFVLGVNNTELMKIK
jgi:16S rRNA U516 pseudouridylate synthase RsuA-like enzyme